MMLYSVAKFYALPWALTSSLFERCITNAQNWMLLCITYRMALIKSQQLNNTFPLFDSSSLLSEGNMGVSTWRIAIDKFVCDSKRTRTLISELFTCLCGGYQKTFIVKFELNKETFERCAVCYSIAALNALNIYLLFKNWLWISKRTINSSTRSVFEIIILVLRAQYRWGSSAML